MSSYFFDSVALDSIIHHIKQKSTSFEVLFWVVEHRGLEPLTPTLPVLCAPNCANAPENKL